MQITVKKKMLKSNLKIKVDDSCQTASPKHCGGILFLDVTAVND